MARLAVNVDHVATVREARGTKEPDPVLAAGLAELAGADGIICHLREDRRHISDRDLALLRRTVKTMLNMEMAAVEEMVDIALEILPDLVTFVPEKREEVTTEGGLDVTANPVHYRKTAERLKASGIRVSFFIDPDKKQLKEARQCGGDVVEFHTGHYAEARSEADAAREFKRIQDAANSASELNLGVSAGHGLDYINVKRFADLSLVEEYSIGHSIVARAVMVGFERAVQEMVGLIKNF